MNVPCKFVHTSASLFMSGYENTAIGTEALPLSSLKSRGVAVDFVDIGCGYLVPQYRKMTDEELSLNRINVGE